MNFVSEAFLYFSLAFFPAYYLLPYFSLRIGYRNILILTASYVFYGYWDYRFLSLIIFSSTLDYICGLAIEKWRGETRARHFLVLSITANIGLLAIFKYAGFFVSSFVAALHSLGIDIDTVTLSIVLPVGISFYTFQSMSYTLDVYSGKTSATRNLVAFLAYVSFFPQLVAGPIERASRLLPQFLSVREFTPPRFRRGLRDIVYGLFTKLVIADNLAPVVNGIYADIGSASPAAFSVATVGFALQIYFDFSAYSRIARGLAAMMGFELIQNFDSPYGACSLTDFWRRWHISLSTWFRDYVYIPLGGNRVGALRSYSNTLLVFLLSGLWHGANWTFVIWGAIHGGILCLERLLKGSVLLERGASSAMPGWLRTIVGWFATMVMVMYAWVYFRAETLGDAWSGSILFWRAFISWSAVSQDVYRPVIAGTAVVFVELVVRSRRYDYANLPLFIRWLGYMILVFAILGLGSRDEADFVYFQF